MSLLRKHMSYQEDLGKEGRKYLSALHHLVLEAYFKR